MKTNRQNQEATVIALKELPPEGQTFHYSKASGELNHSLRDLIQDHDFTAEIEIKPMGNAFHIGGKIKSEQDLTCSRCGREMVSPIQDEFQELIVIHKETPKGGHTGHTGSQEDGIFCNYLTSHTFDLSEFIHEHVASAEPYAPICSRPDCETYLEKLKGELAAKSHNTSPFSVLKKLSVRGQKD